ncbi:ArsR/SmtB family transcription factor [Halopseudomonas salegens]|uniref:Transcriptional regulator, ArsR family n=1 Tax=Halopseudomonas salegens TaxID=1434072 RepID=A0A1H2HMM7_9GAMM|nr:metalloregulator ArsR/SmtB family transcription factor [Halopseudomonas salegens]SDU32828.1 transcriptional regulator, ArsR family [Halopseudomonas salegens]
MTAPALSPSADQLDIARLRASADQAQALLKTLANRDRLLLLCQLVAGERNVSELEASVGIQQPTLSQQLAVLRREGLVATRREGKQIFYRIDSPEALAVLQTLYQLFCDEASV